MVTITAITNRREELTNIRNILLTGATGFVGAFLLHELLMGTQAKVHCLVRAAGVEQGKDRIRDKLRDYSLWKAQWDSRIVPVIGDLSRSCLGLTHEDFKIQAEKLDAIYHVGALLNHVLPYAQLQATNVRGTQEILRLAGCGRRKPVYYVSTLRLFGSRPGGEPIRENDEIDQSQIIGSGYAQSKWVAEKLIRSAGSRGIPCVIFRPGMTSGDSRTGISNTNDPICRMIKGCIQLGSAPAMEMPLHLTPIDFVAWAIVQLSRQEESIGETFHLVNPAPISWNQIIDAIVNLGYPLRRLPYEAWLPELREAARKASVDALAPLLQYFSSETPGEFFDRQFDNTHTLQRLKAAAVVWPHIGRRLLQSYLGALSHIGFIEPPPASRKEGSLESSEVTRTLT